VLPKLLCRAAPIEMRIYQVDARDPRPRSIVIRFAHEFNSCSGTAPWRDHWAQSGYYFELIPDSRFIPLGRRSRLNSSNAHLRIMKPTSPDNGTLRIIQNNNVSRARAIVGPPRPCSSRHPLGSRPFGVGGAFLCVSIRISVNRLVWRLQLSWSGPKMGILLKGHLSHR